MIEKIFLIDDMPDQISLVGNILLEEGYKVSAASNLKGVLYYLQKFKPNLILLDMQMDEINGLEICKKIKTGPLTKDIPIIFLTAKTDLKSISEGFEYGANDYIKKPFAKEEFLARVKTQLNLARQTDDLKALNDELMQFLIAVTHDLKAPFTVVNMLIDMLRNELGDSISENADNIMEMLTQKAIDTKKMIESLFEFSVMCNVKPKFKMINTNKIVKETFNDLYSPLENRNIEFKMDDLADLNVDETLFKMAIKNILQNAIKYTSKVDKALIEVNGRFVDYYYVIDIKDNGAGFDMKYYDKMFKIFERLHDSEDFEGTGVGLALVKRIMDRHDGKIEAYGKINEGAKFSLYFPKPSKYL